MFIETNLKLNFIIYSSTNTVEASKFLRENFTILTEKERQNFRDLNYSLIFFTCISLSKINITRFGNHSTFSKTHANFRFFFLYFFLEYLFKI